MLEMIPWSVIGPDGILHRVQGQSVTAIKKKKKRNYVESACERLIESHGVLRAAVTCAECNRMA